MTEVIVLTPDQLSTIIAQAVADGVRQAACTANDDDLLTASECAQLVGCGLDTWYRHAAKRTGPPAIGGARNRRWRRGAVLEWVRQQERSRNGWAR